MSTSPQIVADLKYIFRAMPLAGLLHLRENRHRLVRGHYHTPDNRGCLMSLLTELLPEHQRIDSKKALTRFFGGDPNAPRYQPARWIVRLWDGQICDQVRQRYGDCRRLDEETVFTVLDEMIAERTESFRGAASVHQPSQNQSAEPIGRTVPHRKPSGHSTPVPISAGA